MASLARSSPQKAPRLSLVLASAWSHRWGAGAWALLAGAFLVYFGFAYQVSVGTYAGGARSFGAAAAAVAEAMRPLSGVAERLDTYGGYLTYHNTSLAAGLLSLWAAIQGARALRGWEERGGLELWLAAGGHRPRLVMQRWAGFLLALAVIAAGLALGFGVGTVAAGSPDWPGSIAVAVETALVAAAFYGASMLVANFTRTARAAAGVTGIALVSLYLIANIAPRLGWFEWLRFLSPFFYFHQSHALIPGHSVDLVATGVLVLAATGPVLGTLVAFQRRDLGAPVWRVRGGARETAPAHVAIRRSWLRDAWLADLRVHWLSLLAWTIGGGATMMLVVSMANQVAGVWQSSEIIKQLFMRVPGQTFTDQYMSYITILAAVVPVSFVVAEAARWVGDISEHRTEALLGVCGTRVRIVLEWAMSATAGIVLAALGILAGCALGAWAAGFPLRFDGVVRTVADTVLLGEAILGVGALAVVVFRSGAAVGVLGGLLGAGFFASLFGPMFRWPDWILHLSPFDAFGTPYSAVPRPGGMALLAALALAGLFAAAVVAHRRPSLT